MDKNRIRKKLILEGIFAVLISLTPIFFYYYKFLDTGADSSISILGITITKNGFKNVSIAIYFYFSKIVPLILLIIWFITCKHWWFHAILIPIAMYSFQFVAVLYNDTSKIDENELIYLLGVCMVVIPIVYFIRLKLVDKHVHGIDLDAMDEELKAYREKERLEKELQEKKL